MAKFQAIRGMHDLLPEDAGFWRHIEGKIQGQLHQFGYQEIRLPLLEMTDLFIHSVGTSTDLVQKEMYTFSDRNNDSLTLRPEGTAGCMRAVIEHGLATDKTARLWYSGPMFRHERPQKGRYRQFEQIGVEAIGGSGPDTDVELLELSWRIWQTLGLEEAVTLELNSLGTKAVRQEYRRALVAYFEPFANTLDEASKRRLQTNPIRILDSKAPEIQALVADAPTLIDFLDAESAAHFDEVRHLLQGLGIPFLVNPRIVRGLDYYSKTVFEWTTTALGTQNAICSGGRYDDLVGLLGGKEAPAAGFAFGMDRLIMLLRLLKKQQGRAPGIADVYVLPLSENQRLQALQLAHKLRCSLPVARIVCHTGAGKIKAAMKRADRSGASIALLLGEDEIKAGNVAMKLLREDVAQSLVPVTGIVAEVARILQLQK